MKKTTLLLVKLLLGSEIITENASRIIIENKLEILLNDIKIDIKFCFDLYIFISYF